MMREKYFEFQRKQLADYQMHMMELDQTADLMMLQSPQRAAKGRFRPSNNQIREFYRQNYYTLMNRSRHQLQQQFEMNKGEISGQQSFQSRKMDTDQSDHPPDNNFKLPGFDDENGQRSTG